MDDSAIVRALRGGDPAGAYDRYAGGMYDYCVTVLNDQHEASYAVRDALLVALDRSGECPRTELRAWLYALARNEALRRLRSRTHRPPIDSTLDLGIDPLAEVREGPVRAAAAMLEAPSREVLDLALRHDLDVGGVARVLGVDANKSQTRLDGAIGQLEVAFANIAELADSERARSTGGIRSHSRGRRAADPRRSSDIAARYAALPKLEPPVRLRRDVLSAAREPGLVAYHGEFAGPYNRAGFPVPLDQPHRRRQAPVAAVAAVATLVLLGLGGTAVLVDGIRRDDPSPITVAPAATSGTDDGVASGSDRESPSASPSRKKRPSPGVKASPKPSPSSSPSPSPSTEESPVGTGKRPDLEMTLDYAGSACPSSWVGTAVLTATGNAVKSVTVYYHWWGILPRTAEAIRSEDGSWRVTLTGLPAGRTVDFGAEVFTVDGILAKPPPQFVKHSCDG